MFEYYSRISAKYDREIESIAVFTYKPDRHKYNKYESNFIYRKLSYEYLIYDIARQDSQKLEKSNNPFSFVVKTLIKAFDYIESDENNFNFKKELTGLLLKSGFTEYEIRKIFRFLNFVFEIKDQKIRREFYEEVNKMSLKEKVKFEFTDFEEVALEIASEKKVKEKSEEIAKNMLKEGIDIKIVSKVTGLSLEEIEKL